MPVQEAIAHARAHHGKSLQKLMDLLRIPSISTLSENAKDVRQAAGWIAAHLTSMGMTAQIFPTALHPVVYGELLEAGPRAPTLLVYGHYDVQPVEPIEEWLSPPLNPCSEAKHWSRAGPPT